MSRENRRRAARRWSIAAAALGIIAMLAVAAEAGTIVVDSTADDTAPGHCTLREAINEGQASSGGRGTCTESGGPGAVTIRFAPGLAGEIITLMNSLPAIIYDVTIVGPTLSSQGMNISGNNANRIIENRRTLSLQYLTLANGRSDMTGGAIQNKGQLTITNCTFLSNRAVAPVRSGLAQGGAIFNDFNSRLTIANSTFSGNGVDSDGRTLDADVPILMAGGAIFSLTGAVLTITNSTFADNSVSATSVPGRGRPYTIEGGAIDSNSTLSIVNSTFSGNGVLTNLKSVRGGAIEIGLGATKTISGTILAKSTPGNCDGSFTASYDLSDDSSCRFSGTSRDNVTDIDLDVGLNNNGGPTQTIALTSVTSAAVDFIPPQNCPKTDQRGFIRPATGQARCDAGAFELGAAP